jgi:glutathione S-transferase
MRILYHFPQSPFSRRARLALAHKGLEVELRDARNNPAFLEEARGKSPLRTMPVLVEEDGRAVGESGAIVHYLDAAYPDAPRLWPAGPEDAAAVYGTASLVDGVLNTLVDQGTRIFSLRSHEAWEGVKGEAMRRVQGALDKLAADVPRLGRPTVARSGWSAADIYLFTAVRWLETLPARAESFAPAAQIMSLGWSLPESLSRWADAHRERADVRALD